MPFAYSSRNRPTPFLILRSGGRELALELERTGYDWVDPELERLAADGQQAERSPVEVG